MYNSASRNLLKFASMQMELLRIVPVTLHDIGRLIRREADAHKLRFATVNWKRGSLERFEVEIVFRRESLICG